MFNRKFILLIVLLTLIGLSISSLSAAELNLTDDDVGQTAIGVDEENIICEEESQNDILNREISEAKTVELKASEDYMFFSDIQDAIDNAEEGTVFKLTGTFYGRGQPIIINKCIGLVSDNGATLRANINSQAKSTIFYINSTASNVLLQNLTLTNGDDMWGGRFYHTVRTVG